MRYRPRKGEFAVDPVIDSATALSSQCTGNSESVSWIQTGWCVRLIQRQSTPPQLKLTYHPSMCILGEEAGSAGRRMQCVFVKLKHLSIRISYLRRAVHIPSSPPSMRPGDHLFIFQIWLNLYMLTEMGLCARMLRRVVD